MKATAGNSKSTRRHHASAAKIRRRGIQALERLIEAGIEQDAPIGQTVSLFLLSVQRSAEFWCDLSLLRNLSVQQQDDCLAVLALYLLGERPLHAYVANGEEALACLVERWWLVIEPSEMQIAPSS